MTPHKTSPHHLPRCNCVRQASTNWKSILLAQASRVEMVPGEKPARFSLGFSCYILSLAIPRSMVSSPTSSACRETYCAERTGSGSPHVAGAFVEALTTEAGGAPKQVLTTCMAHVAERQETVIDCFGAFRVKEAYSAEEMPATQGKAKVTMTFNAPGVIKSDGGAGMLDEGLKVRDVRRTIAQTLKAKGAEKAVGTGLKTELALQKAQQK